ncbi:DNA-directed RNA polymerase subunit omega [Isoptericola cucumis]|uniref:DNA-directed RNA polymerase subunit omega n=1 Tax=Isoptericola cucumis TaxID=1776856 RepID=A0ABQ2B448_9MICO|nr:DNA-directed RNA polymerase subunit omega [Isoptericola cucumis]GGI07368.1 DNA-directed RNA polymerase subunit omega [Isoptericola cucumis]
MAGTVAQPIGITDPPIDELLQRTDSKYGLVLYAAQRARQINAYYSQLNEGLLENVGPLVETRNQEKPLSIAMREINEGLLVSTPVEEKPADATAAAEPVIDFGDAGITGLGDEPAL